MKKVLIFHIIATASFVFYSCGGGSGSGDKTTPETKKEETKPVPTDFKMLSDETEFKKVYNMAIEKLGDNVKYVSEISFSMSRDSEGGGADGMDYLTVKVQYLHPKNKNKLEEYSYWSTSGKWEENPATVTVSPIGDPEEFRLEDYLMDLSSLTFEKVNQAVQDTYAKFEDDEKYIYQYVSSVTIEDGEIKIFIHGKLKSNEQIKFEDNTVKL